MESLSSCAGDRENHYKCGEQKELKHSKWSSKRNRVGGTHCASVNGWPHCLLKQSPGKLLWDHHCHLHTPICLACPIVSSICGGLGCFILRCLMLPFSHSWIFFTTSAEVFQAWWWKPTDYREAIWAAVVPGIRSSGEEMWEDERRLWGLFFSRGG